MSTAESLFDVRPVEAADWALVARALAAQRGTSEETEAEDLERRFVANPSGATAVCAVDESGGIQAFLGASHVPVRTRGNEGLFGVVTGFVDPAYRVGGIHSVLAALDDAFDASVSIDGGPRLLCGLWEETDWWWWRHLAGWVAVHTEVELLRPESAAMPASEGVEIVEADDARLDAWAEPMASSDCTVLRDGAWLRIVRGPADRVLLATRADAVVGAVMVRPSTNGAEVRDWALASDDEDAAFALLGAVVSSTEGPVRASVWTGSRRTLWFFQEAGFRLRAGRERYLAVRTRVGAMNQQWLGDHWEVFGGLLGEPNPRMTVGEQIVSPPPAGTRAGRDAHGWS